MSGKDVSRSHVRELGQERAEDRQRRSHDAKHVAPANQTVARVVGGGTVAAIMAGKFRAQPEREDEKSGNHDENWNRETEKNRHCAFW